MADDIKLLQEKAKQLRRDVLTMVYKAGDGHPGPALSAADIITALYFKIMKVDAKNPQWQQRDRFILSKGHACPVLYAALARKGYFPLDWLPTLRCFGSKLQGHPDMNKTPGIDMTSGSLGNGLSIGLGMALAGRYLNSDNDIYVITGDGELEEGVIWEGVLSAVKHKAGHLIVFVDNNGWQSGDSVDNISSISPIMPKFEGFGWHCQEIDGHDMQQILTAVDLAKKEVDRPSVIVARTIKGKGVPFMENDNSWHKRVPTKEQFEEAIRVLGGAEIDAI